MKNILFAVFLLFTALLIPTLSAQSSTRGSTQVEKSSTGVRFVSNATAGTSFPPQLYYQLKKGEFHEISIGARVPSLRVRPKAGVIEFWTEMPIIEEAPKGKRAEKTKVPPPNVIISVPVGMENALCFLQALPHKKDAARIPVRTTFISPREMPTSGQHVLNLTKYNFAMSTSKIGDFSDKKVVKIGACKNIKIASRSNMWSFKGKRGETLSFLLSCKYPDKKNWVRVRASRFVVSDSQAQLSVLLADPVSKRVKMIFIQVPRG